MGWSRATTAPQGFGVFGGSAILGPAETSLLVRAEYDSPQVWTVALQTTGPVDVEVVEGNGQTATAKRQTVAGPTFLQVTAQTVEVRAFNSGAAPVTVSASCAPGNGPGASPSVARVEFSSGLAPAVQTPFTQSSAQTRLIHNNTGGVVTVFVPSGGADCFRLANQATLTLSYGGSFDLLSAGGGAVSVVGLYL